MNANAAVEPLPPLTIGEHTLAVPIIQGGMGVRVSAHKLAAAVGNAGGAGIIATVALSLASKHYKKGKDYYKANIKALIDELQWAREKSPKGIIGANCMVAIRDYEDMVRTSVMHGAQMIISGAGLPLRLPEFAKDNTSCALVPIISSLRAAKLLTKRWHKLYKRIPDALVFEDPNTAGGHLGVDRSQLYGEEHGTDRVVPELAEWSRKEYGDEIPIVTAGGIWDRSDIDRVMAMGAKGVQMASRFICTHECDAADSFKESFIRAKQGDVVIIDSPAGLPGRALKTQFTNDLFRGAEVGHKCFATCLEACRCRDDKDAFCIAEALHLAQQGDMERGLVFTGTNATRHTEIVHVQDIFDEINGAAHTPQ
ncbi:NAD(P)H-dependent flavin oxidoreductase [Magnetofaba australis]|uniref:Putative 2-nitropropane dioxygenase n=1 Tax=Magnetofaba australis IT-1 TaxID=1434232 RepID=A0A1Y2K0Q5_9PROT|nr:nitronate monooxygenase family protein [Magnetofaba australis]OSM00384.1 putative 2-nitropropane dioxygenase [Magnetofaba australis IT-1]